MYKRIYLRRPRKRQICPVCNCASNRKVNKIVIEKLESIKAKNLLWYSNHPWNGGVDQLFEQSHFEWACDNCVEAGKAIEAQIEKQTYCDYPPYLMYFDKIMECQQCASSFTFSKEEQKYWYEELEFWVQSTPKHCEHCRKEIRKKKGINTELSQLLKNGDENLNSKVLYRIAELYQEMGKDGKMKMYLSKAAKQMRKEM